MKKKLFVIGILMSLSAFASDSCTIELRHDQLARSQEKKLNNIFKVNGFKVTKVVEEAKYGVHIVVTTIPGEENPVGNFPSLPTWTKSYSAWGYVNGEPFDGASIYEGVSSLENLASSLANKMGCN